METKSMNIYKKLYNAACQSSGVKKGKKVSGMQFNPLQHDEVQKVAMEALLDNGLYPLCTYTNEIKDNFILVICNMKIFNVENPNEFIEINGCSAMGNLDKFGTGNGMSYAKKYAFLNALNLKTGLDNDDGYQAKPFTQTNIATNKIPHKNSGTEHNSSKAASYVTKEVHQIIDEIKNCKNIYELRQVTKQNQPFLNNALKNKSPAQYVDLTDLIENKQVELNRRANG